jgi:membrane-associated phospholipid phosphatase
LPYNNLDHSLIARSETDIEAADIAAAEKLGQHRNRPMVRAVGTVSEVADQAPAVAICAAVLFVGIFAYRPKVAEAGGRMLASVLLATAIKSIIKGAITRTRPNVLIEQGDYDFRLARADNGGRQLFPSGHTADAAAAARGLARIFPGASGAAYTAALVVATLQVPRAKHYPLDLAAGAIVGVLSETLVDRAAAILKSGFLQPARGCQDLSVPT